MSKKFVKVTAGSCVLSNKCELANNPFTRFMGLMFRKSLPTGHWLLLDPCNQIHTFNMKFSIDAVNLDENNRVISVFKDVKPGKVMPFVKGGKKVLEMNFGEAEHNCIEEGSVLVFTEIKN